MYSGKIIAVRKVSSEIQKKSCVEKNVTVLMKRAILKRYFKLNSHISKTKHRSLKLFKLQNIIFP